jgi:hypothetical protein
VGAKVDRPRVIVGVAVLLAVLVGAAGYYGVSALLDGRAGRAAPAVRDGAAALSAARHKQLLARVEALEKRIDELEGRPSLSESLDDEKVRKQLTQLMVEARRRDREEEDRKRREERAGRVVRYYRSGYDRVLAEARQKAKVDEETWKALAPAFDKHFEPVAKAIRDRAGEGDGRWRWVRVNINRAVAPVLPQTIAAVRKQLPAEGWKAFDEWRRKPELNRYGFTPRAEYFLPPEDLKKVKAVAATRRRWDRIKRSLPELKEQLKLDAEKWGKLEKALYRHAEEFTAAFDGRPFVDVNDAGNQVKVKAVARRTTATVKKLLADAEYAKFDRWMKDPDSRVYVYFGVDVARRIWPGREDPPARPPKRPEPTRPKEVF